MFRTCDPRGRATFDPRDIICTILVEVHKEMLHSKYQSSMPSSFREEDFQRFCYFFSFWLPWQPELRLEFNLLNNFGRTSPKEHPCQVSSRLAQWFRRRRCLKKLWTTDDMRRTLGDHKSSL